MVERTDKMMVDVQSIKATCVMLKFELEEYEESKKIYRARLRPHDETLSSGKPEACWPLGYLDFIEYDLDWHGCLFMDRTME